MVILLFVALVKNLAPPDTVFLAASAVLALCGIITAEEAFAGFSNSGMITVAILFVVAAGLRETGVLDYLGHQVLGGVRTANGALGRLSVVVIPLSAFLNNTPIVAMFVPVVIDWSRRNRVSPSKLLIPLSYLTILGGTCTLIGTSTNLVVNGLMIKNGVEGMSLFEIGKVGLPYALIRCNLPVLFRPASAPGSQRAVGATGRHSAGVPRRDAGAARMPLGREDGRSSGLRQLPGLFLD